MMKIYIVMILLYFQVMLYPQVDQWKVFNTQNSTIPADHFYCLTLDKEENLWLAAHGIAKWDKQHPTSFLQYQDLGSDIVRMTGDSLGNVWLSLEAPWIIRTDAINWTTFPFDGSIWTTCVDINNNLWCGAGNYRPSSTSLHKYNGNEWTVYDTVNSGLPYQRVLKVTSDLNGKIWGLAAADNSSNISLFSFDGLDWNSTPAPYPPHWVSTITADKNGNIWYATAYPEEGIVQYDGLDFIFHPKPDSTFYFPTTLTTDTSGNLWVCWENGLAEYSNNVWTTYRDSIFFDFSDMVVDKNNNIWLSTYGQGVVLFNKDGVVLSTDSYNPNFPNEFSLSQNYPNPFNPVTTIKYTIPNVTLSGVEGSRVVLKVYDILGREVATLVNKEQNAGSYNVDFSATGGASHLASGIYFYRLQAGSFVDTKKMILLK